MWLRWMGNVRNLVNACALGEQGCAVRNLDTPNFFVRPAKYRPVWRAPRWFAAITTTQAAFDVTSGEVVQQAKMRYLL